MKSYGKALQIGRLLCAATLCAFFAAVCGCADKTSRGEVTNVDRLFMHEPNDYTIMWVNGQKVHTKRFQFPKKMQIVADLLPNDPMRCEWSSDSCGNMDVVIHVHSSADVNDSAAVKNGEQRKGAVLIMKQAD